MHNGTERNTQMPNPSIGLPSSTRPFLLFPLASFCSLLCLNVKQNQKEEKEKKKSFRQKQEGWGQNKKIKLSYEEGKILLENVAWGVAGGVLAQTAGSPGFNCSYANKHTLPPLALNAMHKYRQYLVFPLKQTPLHLVNFSPPYVFTDNAEVLVTGLSYDVSIFWLCTAMRSPGRDGLAHLEIMVQPAFELFL